MWKVVEVRRVSDRVIFLWDMHSAGDLVMCLSDINGHLGRHIDRFDVVHGGYGAGLRNLEGRMLLEFCLEKELCMSNTWLRRKEKRKVTFRMAENETEIDFVLINKEHRRFIQNVKELPEEFEHASLVADIDRKIRNIVRKT